MEICCHVRYLTVLPSIHLLLPVSVASEATLGYHGDMSLSTDKSRDVYSRTAGVTAVFNQSSLLAIILSRLVRTGPAASAGHAAVGIARFDHCDCSLQTVDTEDGSKVYLSRCCQ